MERLKVPSFRLFRVQHAKVPSRLRAQIPDHCNQTPQPLVVGEKHTPDRSRPLRFLHVNDDLYPVFGGGGRRLGGRRKRPWKLQFMKMVGGFACSTWLNLAAGGIECKVVRFCLLESILKHS